MIIPPPFFFPLLLQSLSPLTREKPGTLIRLSGIISCSHDSVKHIIQHFNISLLFITIECSSSILLLNDLTFPINTEGTNGLIPLFFCLHLKPALVPRNGLLISFGISLQIIFLLGIDFLISKST
ncbi:hypothetical protein GDO81_017759 [Engystomops pustulosus]|uniref:Uncharacterized protein n=1 Tax=Engystomops pustulosus TaxID=76066 RepID=A0AAV7AA93_ENGPU|nr:hypothetical protein GDO81_017759 [Engystomops pustulosus]